MKKILVGVDGSMASIHAAKKALELAEALEAEVTLMHVQPPTVLPGDVPLTPLAELRTYELARGAGILKDVLGLLDAQGLKTLNVVGSPAEVLADTAFEGGYEMAVVGNKGHSAVMRVLVGSVADRLVHICRCPVLVVR